MFEPERERDFLQLARDRAFLGEEQIFGELLGDGRAALRSATAQNVGDKGARDTQGIDAMMRVEAAVLDGNEGLGHVSRQFAKRHRSPAHVAPGRERRAVQAKDQHRGRSLRDFQRLDPRQMDADPSRAPIPAISAHSASTKPQ